MKYLQLCAGPLEFVILGGGLDHYLGTQRCLGNTLQASQALVRLF